MPPMWYCAGTPVDLDDTNWRISSVDTDAKDSLNPEALQRILTEHVHVDRSCSTGVLPQTSTCESALRQSRCKCRNYIILTGSFWRNVRSKLGPVLSYIRAYWLPLAVQLPVWGEPTIANPSYMPSGSRPKAAREPFWGLTSHSKSKFMVLNTM